MQPCALGHVEHANDGAFGGGGRELAAVRRELHRGERPVVRRKAALGVQTIGVEDVNVAASRRAGICEVAAAVVGRQVDEAERVLRRLFYNMQKTHVDNLSKSNARRSLVALNSHCERECSLRDKR